MSTTKKTKADAVEVDVKTETKADAVEYKCLGNISADGKKYSAGDAYKGDHIENLLKSGVIEAA